MSLSFCSEVPQFSPTHTFHNNSLYLLLCWIIPWDQRACQQSIVETELFPFNSRLVHVHEQNVGHFLASWYECECELTIPAQILRQSWLERHFAKKSTFWIKFLIVNEIRTAPFYLCRYKIYPALANICQRSAQIFPTIHF